jgi:hypothetical protein
MPPAASAGFCIFDAHVADHASQVLRKLYARASAVAYHAAPAFAAFRHALAAPNPCNSTPLKPSRRSRAKRSA